MQTAERRHRRWLKSNSPLVLERPNKYFEQRTMEEGNSLKKGSNKAALSTSHFSSTIRFSPVIGAMLSVLGGRTSPLLLTKKGWTEFCGHCHPNTFLKPKYSWSGITNEASLIWRTINSLSIVNSINDEPLPVPILQRWSDLIYSSACAKSAQLSFNLKICPENSDF